MDLECSRCATRYYTAAKEELLGAPCADTTCDGVLVARKERRLRVIASA